MSNRFEVARALIAEAGDTPELLPDAVPRALLDEIIAAATCRYSARFVEPPWRFVVVVGQEREGLGTMVAEALTRHWGLGNLRPRGSAPEGGLRAPALVLVFSRIPSSEGLDAIAQTAAGVQNLLLLAAANGLAIHRTFAPNQVPEAVLDFVAGRLGPAYRECELVTTLAIGYP